MSDTETERWIAALERARAELEGALSANPHWLALREAMAARAEHDRALAGNPVYLCWAQLDAAIASLRREAQGGTAGPAPARRRLSLRDVLEHIRADAAPQGTEPQAGAVPAELSEPSDAEPPSASEPTGPATPPMRAGGVRAEREEATVSFVIREPARPAAESQNTQEAPKQPAPPEAPRTEPEADPGAEAEVTIVPRRR